MSYNTNPSAVQFVKALHNEPNWYILGIFMDVPTTELDIIDRNCGKYGNMRCLTEVYKFIKSKSLPLSWQLIAESLRNMNNNALAEQIESEYILPFLEASPLSKYKSGAEGFNPMLPVTPSTGNERHCLAPEDNIGVVKKSSKDQTETQYLNAHPSANQEYLHPLVHSQMVESDVPTELGMCGNLEEEGSPASEQVLSRPHPPPSFQPHQPLQLTSAAVAVKKDFPSPAVESDVFIDELSQDQRWYTLGILLGVPTHKLDTISVNYGSSGIRECLGELYKCCKELEGGMSWEQIVEALWKMKNVLLAASIHSKYTISPSPLSESEDSVQNRAKQVEVPDEVVQGFNNLSLQFSKLKHNVRQSIRQSKISVDDLQEVISDECSFESLSGKEATVDNFLNRLSQYYSLLDVRVLEFLFKTLFSKDHPVQRQLTGYIRLLDKFKSSAEMKHLVYLLKQQQTVNSGHKLVELKVREIWSSFTLKKFEKVLRAILKTKYSYTSQMTVEEGCICISWVIPDIHTSKLIQPQPLEFLKIIGVVYLHIGDEVVFSLPEDGCDTLEAAMLQAVELKNTQAIELLQAVGSDNKDIFTESVDNVVNVVSSVTDSSDTAAVTSISSSSTEREHIPVIYTHSQCMQEPLSTQPGHHKSDDVFTQELFKNTDSELEEITDTSRPEDENLEILKILQTEKLKQKDSKLVEITDTSRPEKEYLEIPNKLLKRKQEGGSLEFDQVEDVVQADLTISEPSLESEDHDIKIQITEEYWNEDATRMLHCSLASGLNGYGDHIPGFFLISPLFYLSCETDQPVEVQLTVPHVLVTLSKDQLERIVIFSSSTSELSCYSIVKFNRLQTPDLIMDHHFAMFTTILHKSSYFVMGLASSTGGASLLSPLPVVPLQCSLYVEYPADSNDYITGSDVDVYVTLNLKTIELYRKKHQRENTKLERVNFILSELEATTNGVLNNSSLDWLSLRQGDGVCQYTKIAYGDEESSPHWYPITFVVQCLNPKELLKFRTSVTSGDYELAEVSITTTSNLLSKEDRIEKVINKSGRPVFSEKKLAPELQEAMDNGVNAGRTSESSVDPTRTLVPADVFFEQCSVTSGQDKEIAEIIEVQPNMNKDYKSTMEILSHQVTQCHLTRNSSSLVSENCPGIKIEITSNYWSQYPSDEVSCQLAVPSFLNCIWPSGYIFIGRATYLSCETEQPVDVKITSPHSLATSSEDHSMTTVVFASTACLKNKFSYSLYSLQELIPVKISDLTIDDDNISFTTIVSGPSLFVVGVPLSTVDVAPSPLPVVPLQCVAFMDCSSDSNRYLRGTNIHITISMDLLRKQKGKKYFTLPGPLCTVSGTVETGLSSGWQSVRRGKELFHYDEITFSEKWNKKWCSNPPRVTARFFVKCFDSKEPLKFRVTVFCHNNNELVNKLLTPVEQTEEPQSGDDNAFLNPPVRSVEDTGSLMDSNSVVESGSLQLLPPPVQSLAEVPSGAESGSVQSTAGLSGFLQDTHN